MKHVLIIATALLLGGCTVYNVPHHGSHYYDPWPVRVPIVQPYYVHPHYPHPQYKHH